MSLNDFLERSYYKYRGFIPSKVLYHRDYFQVLELLSSDSITQQQAIESRLRHILTTAVNWVPFYKATVKLTAAELDNENPLDLIERFPFLEKADVMIRQKDFLDSRLDPNKLNYATSGGSTGQGIGLWRNKRLADIEKAFFAHEWGKLGFSFDKSRYVRIGADARRQSHESADRIVGNRLMLSPYHMNLSSRDQILAALNQYKPDFVHSYPSSAAALSDLIESKDLEFKVKGLLLASEPATEIQLSKISRLFNAPISINYGLTERTNMAFSSYSSGQIAPYQFVNLYGFNENRTVDGRSEIVGTSLWNDVMPLIRYCTNDFAYIDTDGKCTHLEGRNQEYLIGRANEKIPGLSIVIDEVTWDFIKYYQVRQFEVGKIQIAVVAKNGLLTKEQRDFVLNAQLKRWGSFFDVSLEQVEDIPLTKGGKRRLVVSEL